MKLRVGLVMAGLVGMVTLGVVMAAEISPSAQKEGATMTAAGQTDSLRSLGLALGAGLVGSLSILGAGIAVGRVGSAAIGAISEKPDLFVRALIFVVIAEGLAGIGFGLAAYILTKL